MRRNIFRILLTLAIVVLALEWASSGYILIQMGQWTLESRPVPFILICLIVVWLAWTATKVWVFVRIIPERMHAKSQERSRIKAVKALLNRDHENARALLNTLPQHSEADELIYALIAARQQEPSEVRAALDRLQRLQPGWKDSIEQLRQELTEDKTERV